MFAERRGEFVLHFPVADPALQLIYKPQPKPLTGAAICRLSSWSSLCENQQQNLAHSSPSAPGLRSPESQVTATNPSPQEFLQTHRSTSILCLVTTRTLTMRSTMIRAKVLRIQIRPMRHRRPTFEHSVARLFDAYTYSPYSSSRKDHRTMASRPSPALIKLLILAQREKCFYCDGAISFDTSRGWLMATVDHFYPTSRGGSKGISNVVVACKGCNNRKRARPPRLHELVKWNKLAVVWPHINPVDLEPLVPQKACRSCGQQIPIDRLLKTRVSLSETQTCSPECARKRRNRSAKRIRRRLAAGMEERTETRSSDPGQCHGAAEPQRRLS
jgi:hypothetical protein